MRKWGILIIIIILGGAIYIDWLSKKEFEVIGYILNTSPDIDSISIRDGKTKEELLAFSKSDSAFSELGLFYRSILHLNGTEKDILNGETLAEIDYYENGEVRYTVSIYQLEDDITVNRPVSNLYTYQYTPKGITSPFVFALKDNYILFGVNRGMKDLVNLLIQEKALYK
ncbi:hypothetical protein [Ureibacillus acetophenoni]|uniref:Uncharacterized protein n=1 Tax=Ureibacillus acetophenoni TaxID=614649 RepID=A0A285UPK1_9BACL|nr:hypothetical protein [Ureibacillus acetophenoni]SOC43742.1 hypothetical protein SAMN05877842_11732 [Ureibacillus acetophenoni]